MIKPKSIDHIVLRTDRYQELIAFYCNIIGCSLERETEDEFGLTQLRAGNSLIDIVDVNGKLGKSGGVAPQEKGNNLDHFCLQIEPFEERELKLFLDSYNVEYSEFQDRYGAQGMGRSIYLKDIAGNNIELRSVV
jgi:glyoxylase I family protein